MKLALSILCEHPQRRTGLTTLFHEFVAAGLRTHPEHRWIVLAGPEQEWTMDDPRVEVVRMPAGNDRRARRLLVDHVQVGPEARRRRADVLLTVGFVPLRTGRLPVVMHVFSLHHLNTGGGLASRYRRWAVANGLRRARLVVVNSEWTAARLRAAYGLRPGFPLCVSHEGLQHGRFRPDGERGRSDLPRGYLLWSGNFYGYKRVELTLTAFAGMDPELRARHPLVLVGGDWDGGRARAETLAHALGVGDQVRFLGWAADTELPALYRGARAHVLSTAEETFGRSVTEAMACGCPCVLQDLPVLREVTAGAASFVDFADIAAATRALERICRDAALVAQLRADGLRRAADFSFERLARERLDAIEAALGKDRS